MFRPIRKNGRKYYYNLFKQNVRIGHNLKKAHYVILFIKFWLKHLEPREQMTNECSLTNKTTTNMLEICSSWQIYYNFDNF